MATHEAGFHGPLAELLARRATGEAGVPATAELLLSADDALPVRPAVDRRVWDPESGSVDRPATEDIIRRAELDAAQPWPLPLASAAARVHRDGDRAAWEALAFERQRRLSRAAVAAAVTLDDGWIDAVADGAWLLCEQSSWCWPAHDDTLARHGAVLATVDDPYLDLGAGEVVGQLAWLDHLLGTQLDERYAGLRARIRREARNRVLEPFVRRRDWHWLGLDGDVHNWNPWIHGNVLVAALRLMDDPAESIRRAEVVALVIEGLDRYIAALPIDGAIDEGYSYWWNGASRVLEALDLLAHATGGFLDAAASIESLRQTVAFPHRMHFGGDWYLNLADGQAKPSAEQPWHALHRAARRVGDDAARRHAAAHRRPGAPAATEREGLGRLLRGITDPAWLSEQQAPSPLPRESWLGSTQVLVAREREGTAEGLTLAVKGGHNGEHHNHNDVGSFVVAVDGVPVIVDAGRPTYTAATFGPDRYDIWTMQSSWHNVPEIRGTAQSAGADCAASHVSAGLGADSHVSLQLNAAYRVPGLAVWRRRAGLNRSSAQVVIDDEWEFEPSSELDQPPTSVHLLVAGDVRLADAGARVTPLDGARDVLIAWSPPVVPLMTERPLDDVMLSEVWGPRLTRIELPVTELRSIRVTVEVDAPTSEDAR